MACAARIAIHSLPSVYCMALEETMPTTQPTRAMNISSSSRTEENALGLLLRRRLLAVRTNSPFFFQRPRKMPRAIAWLRPMLAIEAMIVSYHEHGTRLR